MWIRFQVLSLDLKDFFEQTHFGVSRCKNFFFDTRCRIVRADMQPIIDQEVKALLCLQVLDNDSGKKPCYKIIVQFRLLKIIQDLLKDFTWVKTGIIMPNFYFFDFSKCIRHSNLENFYAAALKGSIWVAQMATPRFSLYNYTKMMIESNNFFYFKNFCQFSWEPYSRIPTFAVVPESHPTPVLIVIS